MAGSDSYEKWYRRRSTIAYCLLGVWVAVGTLHFATGLHYDNVEMPAFLGPSMPGWETVKTVETVTSFALSALSVPMGLMFFSLPWLSPEDLPPGVSTARFRAAVGRIRNGMVGGAPETDHVARIAAENLIRRGILDARILLPLQAYLVGLVFLLSGSGPVRGILEGDSVLALLRSGTLFVFVCVFAAPWRLVFLRRRALEFRGFHEALLRELYGVGR
ncbi:hypothetical protein [Nocardiopsis sp. CC223A]|uniref:hypothetical protein n=1 Tax=Nocardiopsis sp. CC223A TaxID=3044051 RepID=UPI00278BC9AD|nr:hypothetical protein [Nocardiopsis sp. CC223A]